MAPGGPKNGVHFMAPLPSVSAGERVSMGLVKGVAIKARFRCEVVFASSVEIRLRFVGSDSCNPMLGAMPNSVNGE